MFLFIFVLIIIFTHNNQFCYRNNSIKQAYDILAQNKIFKKFLSNAAIAPFEITFNLGLAWVLNVSAVFIYYNQCVLSGVWVGFRHFSFFHETMLFSLVFLSLGSAIFSPAQKSPHPQDRPTSKFRYRRILGLFQVLTFYSCSVKCFTVGLTVTPTHNVYTLSVTLLFSPQTLKEVRGGRLVSSGFISNFLCFCFIVSILKTPPLHLGFKTNK